MIHAVYGLGMQINLEPSDLKILIKLLDMAGDEFANHSCNDFHLLRDGGLTPGEAEEMKTRMQVEFSEDEAQAFTSDYQSDCLLFRRFQQLFEEALEKPVPATRPKDSNLDSVDLKVLVSILDHAAEEFHGRRGYSFVEHCGLTPAEDQELNARMSAFLETLEAAPFNPAHDWYLHYSRFERVFEDLLPPADRQRILRT